MIKSEHMNSWINHQYGNFNDKIKYKVKKGTDRNWTGDPRTCNPMLYHWATIPNWVISQIVAYLFNWFFIGSICELVIFLAKLIFFRYFCYLKNKIFEIKNWWKQNQISKWLKMTTRAIMQHIIMKGRYTYKILLHPTYSD